MSPASQGLLVVPLACPRVAAWLTRQAHLGLARNTLAAYARALTEYSSFCHDQQIDVATATRDHVAAYVHYLATRPVARRRDPSHLGLANAMMHQRLVAVRLYYDYLQEQQVREDNPLQKGYYTPAKGFGGIRRGLLPYYQKLPWIPTDDQWQAILGAAQAESARNRFMFALAYDAGLRREELCALQTGDIDPTHRLLSLRDETTKTRRARVVPYSLPTSTLYSGYLAQRRQLSRERGPLFLSESHRNRGRPLTIWTWSKTVQALAHRAGVPQFTTHTLRHLCLTDLARAGWQLPEIAAFAGHRSLESTLTYIHLSGRDLVAKLAQGMAAIHDWRLQTMQQLFT